MCANRQTYKQTLFALAFRNGMQYHLVNASTNSSNNASSNNASTSCKNVVNIGPVTSQFKREQIKIFTTTG